MAAKNASRSVHCAPRLPTAPPAPLTLISTRSGPLSTADPAVMAATMRTVASSRMAATRSAPRTVVVRAQAQETSSRRALLGLIATGVAAAVVAVPQQASAIVIPSQESYGGLGRATGKAGSSPKSPTRASMEGYTLEGTKKSGVSPKRKAKLLAKARKAAEAQAK